MTLDNPYWDALREHARPAYFRSDRLEVLRWNRGGDRVALDRHNYTLLYSWTITDPVTVEFVAEYAGDGLVDPMAGTGYWGFLLEQLGVDVVCYDLRPGDNPWHKTAPLHMPVERMDGAEAVEKHPDRVLLLAWPPYAESAGAEIVSAYRGDRVIFVGESCGGCTGDDRLFEEFGTHWTEVDRHWPVQWEGLHDEVIVYERKKDARNNET